MEIPFAISTLVLDLRISRDLSFQKGTSVWVQIDNNDNIVTFEYNNVALFKPIITVLIDGLLINIPRYYVT